MLTFFFGDMHCSQFRRCANWLFFLIFRRCDVAPLQGGYQQGNGAFSKLYQCISLKENTVKFHIKNSHVNNNSHINNIFVAYQNYINCFYITIFFLGEFHINNIFSPSFSMRKSCIICTTAIFSWIFKKKAKQKKEEGGQKSSLTMVTRWRRRRSAGRRRESQSVRLQPE